MITDKSAAAPANQAHAMRIGLLNFGGIGDEILFSPVIADLRRVLPDARLTLILEGRSACVAPLLPPLDHVLSVEVLKQSRPRLFASLLSLLRRERFDAVIASGSTPFMAVLLALSGAKRRFGFDSGPLSRALLTGAAPLDTRAYAAQMYYALARTALASLAGPDYTPMSRVAPMLTPPSEAECAWARGRLRPDPSDTRPLALIHPGVSLASVAKGIVKSWSPENWAALIQRLTPGCRVALTGGPDDRETIDAILAALPPEMACGNADFTHLYGETARLSQLGALMTASDALALVDSAPMHLAVGLGRPLTALFGATSPERLLPPDDPRFIALRAAPAQGPDARYLAIPVEVVASAIASQLQDRRVGPPTT
ncbi:MAG: glycosyltransferase family 9 protein [Vampirovibrionales bacterium]|nr:glycosyltransferase family 9 protein [Vampirovibrionales bacterium]